MNFVETRLNLGIDYGTVASIVFATNLLELGDGSEQRQIKYDQPLLRFEIGQRELDGNDINYFEDFFNARQGALVGFRFKDWSDYQLNKVSPVLLTGENNKYQLVKEYKIGNYKVKRPIQKPVNGTVKVYSNGVLINNWELDYTTGVLTTEETNLTVSCEFDVPVRFEQEQIKVKLGAVDSDGQSINEKILFLESLTLTEIRLEFPAIPLDSIPQELPEIINLGIDLGTVGGGTYKTEINKVGAGFEYRNQYELPKGEWEVGQRDLSRSELNYLIALFRVCRGRAVSFFYHNYLTTENNQRARFNSDSISFTFRAYEPATQEAIFDIAGIPIANKNRWVFLFGTFLSKGGPYNGNTATYYCNGGCDAFNYWRNIAPILKFNGDYTLEVVDDFWYVKCDGKYYQIDYIYPNNYLSRDTSNFRGWPRGPFSPHGVGIYYVEEDQPCVQDDDNSPAYGCNLVVTDVVYY